MKIIILHGDDTLRSYERLQKFIDAAKLRNWDVVRVDNSNVNIPEILSATSLFEKEKLVVIEGINLVNKSVTSWLKKKSNLLNLTLVIYHKGTISKTFLKSMPKPDKVEEFKLPKLIWNFLDSFYPGNSRFIISSLHKITKKDPVEFVLALLAKHLRDLYWAKTEASIMLYPSWRVGKLKSQSLRFKEGKLEDLISTLADADINSKTSQANLLDELDFIILTKLELVTPLTHGK